MDHNLREMGVGDLKVPKEMRRMGEAFYGRSQAYRAAWAAADNGALVEALERNIYGGAPAAAAAVQRLAAYMREALRDLARAAVRRPCRAANCTFRIPARFRWLPVKSLTLMKKTANPWSVPVAVEDIPDTGLHIAIDAPAGGPRRSWPNSPVCAICRSFRRSST